MLRRRPKFDQKLGKGRTYRHYFKEGGQWVVDLWRAAVFNSYSTAWRVMDRCVVDNHLRKTDPSNNREEFVHVRQMTPRELRTYTARVLRDGC